MKGSIRTREKCPVCHKPFDQIPRLGFFCPVHKTIPHTFYLSIYIPGHGKFRRSVNSYKDGTDLLGKMNWEIKNHCFDPSRYIKEQVEKFWICNLLADFERAKSKELAPSYVGQFILTLSRIKDFFGSRDVRELLNSDLADLREKLATYPIGPKTLKNSMDIFKSFVRWVRAYKGIEVRNATIWPKIQVTDPGYKWLNPEDQKKIFDKVSVEDRPIIAFMMLHGCRPAEACALKIKDVDLGNKMITISATFSKLVYREKRKGRGAKPYAVPIHSEIEEYISKRVKEALPASWLFENPRTGGHYSQSAVFRIWEKIRKDANLDRSLRLYDATRHSFASQQLALGTDIAEIKEMVGHTDIRTTMRYAHTSLDKMRANLEKMSLQKIIPWGAFGAQDDKKAQNS